MSISHNECLTDNLTVVFVLVCSDNNESQSLELETSLPVSN